MRLADCPAVRAAELNGWETTEPVCPVCGENCQSVFRYMGQVVVGCNVCLQEFDAVEVDECFPA